MEPHLLQIVACLSLAGFFAAMFSYFWRSREMLVPAPPSQSLALSDSVSSPSNCAVASASFTTSCVAACVLLRATYSTECWKKKWPVWQLGRSYGVPIAQTRPICQPLCKSHCPRQTHLSASRFLWIMGNFNKDHGNHDQKLQQGDANNMKALNVNFLNHRNVDSFKAPVIEQLGEYWSSRGSANKNLNEYAGDVVVEELLEKDVGKMQMNSNIVLTPSVRRGRKEINSILPIFICVVHSEL